MTELFEEWEGFQWDQGNLEKSWIRRQVANNECEQFFSINHSLWLMTLSTHKEKNDGIFWDALIPTDCYSSYSQ